MANGAPTLTDDERQRQLAALSAYGNQFPGAASALNKSLTQQLGGGQQPGMGLNAPIPGQTPPPPQTPAPQGGPPSPPPPQGTPAPQTQPSAPGGAPQLPGQGGIMGFLSNPMVVGALTGYLNAIRTPRYQGRGSLIANAGLGFLTGMSGAESALSQQEKDKLDREKEQLEISKTQKINEAWDNIRNNRGTKADLLLVGAGEYLEKEEDRQQTLQDKADIKQVNMQKQAAFIHAHQNDQDAVDVVAGIDPFHIADETKWNEAYEAVKKAPFMKRQIIDGLRKDEASIDASEAAATASREEARKKKMEDDWAARQDPETQREYYMGTAKNPQTFYKVDRKTKEVSGSIQVPAGQMPPTGDAQFDYIPSSGISGYRGSSKSAPETWYNPKNPSETKNIDKDRGDEPPEGWRKLPTGKAESEAAEENRKATLIKKIDDDFGKIQAPPVAAGLRSATGVGTKGLDDYNEAKRQYGIRVHNFDIKSGKFVRGDIPASISAADLKSTIADHPDWTVHTDASGAIFILTPDGQQIPVEAE